MLFYLIYFLLSPFLFLFIHFIKFFNQKIKEHIKNEKCLLKNVIREVSNVNRVDKDVLIFHAASAGEFEQIKPILQRLDRSKYFIIQTFTSPTIYNKEYLNKLFDVCCYHPYDFIWKSYFFFSRIKPKAYIITRHDIWPFHLLIANKLKIKTIYINANLHKNSLWIKPYLTFISKSIFKYLNFCLVPSSEIKDDFLKIIKPEKIIISGDTRFDQIIERKELNKKKTILPNYFNETFNIIFGSYDKYDQSIISESIISFYPKGDKDLKNKKHKIILVPHEINNNEINQLISNLKKHKFSPKFFSKLHNHKNEEIQILIIDTVGILADIYKYATLAYIGSGFHDGVHSVIEPGVYGCVVSFGPNIELLDEAKYMYKNKLGYMIHNKQDMLNFFKLCNNKDQINNLSVETEKYILSKKNTSDKIIDFLETNI